MSTRLVSTTGLRTGRRICTAITRRSVVSSASALASAALPDSSSSTPAHPIIASVLLNRSPVLTTTPTPFEQAYYDYQARIARAISNPFPREFYFKKGAIAERQFFAEESQREKEAFGEGFGDSPLKDLEEDKTGAMSQVEDVVALPREHESDRTGDVKNLNRKGDRNLYLLVESADGWRLPQGPAKQGVALHTVSYFLVLHMDTWTVGRYPIGVHKPSKTESSTILFFKAHIFAGQAKPNGTSIKEFAWLTTEEIKGKVSPEYWASISDMLSSR
ncbi:60S ribosomal protein L17, mitochondrial [Rhizoctonia solani AG-1 IB]|uniref:Large ribosomal subunit protein mL46 n=1 Tax=Thanatephorus cucumeris (strain AG1-IB / isolate 7/3/14) TaxID=1108050 RepID=M5BP92_THACB|nr:60S ribosomal protein L17, mitochondrial [Rhizoctonia solani AG-1 IB]